MVRRFPATDGLDMRTPPYLFLVASLILCRNTNETSKTMETIESAVQKATTEFMKLDGVVGVGQGKNEQDRDCILLFTAQDLASLARKIPPTYKGYNVVIKPLGDIKAQ